MLQRKLASARGVASRTRTGFSLMPTRLSVLSAEYIWDPDLARAQDAVPRSQIAVCLATQVVLRVGRKPICEVVCVEDQLRSSLQAPP